MPSISDLIFILLSGLFGGMIAKTLKQPLILGYIIAGVIVGPNTGGITVGMTTESTEMISMLAEIGVALLLFSLGIEFSIRDLKPIGRIAGIGALVQVAVTLGFGFVLGRCIGWSPLPSFCLAISIVSSSTAVILKSLVATGHVSTLSGRVMLGMSIVQDLTVIPLMIVLTSLNNSGGGSTFEVMQPILMAVVFVVIMVVIGSRVIPMILKVVAHWQSQELFLFSVIAISLGIGYVSYWFGLSFAFGAFVAGLVLAGSDYGNKALSEMIPLRDLFALVFFVSVGMLLDPRFIWEYKGTLALLVVVACVGRGLILGSMCWTFGYRNVIPMAAFLGMMPISEIGFIVIQQASGNDDAKKPAVVRVECEHCQTGGAVSVIARDRWVSIDGPPCETKCGEQGFRVLPQSVETRKRDVECRSCGRARFRAETQSDDTEPVTCLSCDKIVPGVVIPQQPDPPVKAPVIGKVEYSMILNMIVLSMIIGPFVSGYTAPLYKMFGKVFRKDVTNIRIEETKLEKHVVIAGGRYLGRYIARVLRFLKLPHVVIEPNHRMFVKMQGEKLNVLFGDPTQQTILSAANLDKAQLLLITTDAYADILGITRAVKEIRPDLRIVVQYEGQDNLQDLAKLGIDEIVQPEYEVGLEMLRQALISQQVSTQETEHYLDEIRQMLYLPLESNHGDRRLLRRLRRTMGLLELEWILVPVGSELVGQNSSDIRSKITVVGIMRDGVFMPNPDPSTAFQPNDCLAVVGSQEQIENVEQDAKPKPETEPTENRGESQSEIIS